jgi:phage shock protein PspC (stress-responsive transcriptional regulator)
MTNMRSYVGNGDRRFSLKIIVVMIAFSLISLGAFSCQAKTEYGGTAMQKLENGKVSRSLVRLPDTGMIGGICSGMAYKLGIDPWFPRIAFLLLSFIFGAGIFLYIILWALLESAHTPDDYTTRVG